MKSSNRLYWVKINWFIYEEKKKHMHIDSDLSIRNQINQMTNDHHCEIFILSFFLYFFSAKTKMSKCGKHESTKNRKGNWWLFFRERERKKKIRKDSDIMKDTFDDDHRWKTHNIQLVYNTCVRWTQSKWQRTISSLFRLTFR
jgi:hypothetical protein